MRYLLFIPLLFSFFCQLPEKETPPPPVRISGQTMGTSYNIIYLDDQQRNFKKEIDQLLVALNLDVSTYIEEALISRFNRAEQRLSFDPVAHPYFLEVLKASRIIFDRTGGSFDPTIMPLVNYWGFGYTGKEAVTRIDSQQVARLKALVGLDQIDVQQNPGQIIMIKSDPAVQLDFSAIAKGYGVDLVSEYLASHGIDNYLVEIGLETRASGKNDRGQWWKIGINTPREDAQLTDIEAIVSLQNRSLASSGNYRNYHEINGRKYGHEINPMTGFPEPSDLLSVSVLSSSCMEADAYATALMIMGKEKAEQLVRSLDGVDALFIYGQPDGTLGISTTPGIENILDQAKK